MTNFKKMTLAMGTLFFLGSTQVANSTPGQPKDSSTQEAQLMLVHGGHHGGHHHGGHHGYHGGHHGGWYGHHGWRGGHHGWRGHRGWGWGGGWGCPVGTHWSYRLNSCVIY